MGSIAAHSDEAAMAAADETYAARGCCCFWIQWPAVRDCDAWQRIRSTDGDGCPAACRRWWARSLKTLVRVKLWSQTIAGPRWKALVRRPRARGGSSRKRGARFGYDPVSYALNFDDGQASDESDGEVGRRAFCTRYATSPRSSKASMDLSFEPVFVGDDD